MGFRSLIIYLNHTVQDSNMAAAAAQRRMLARPTIIQKLRSKWFRMCQRSFAIWIAENGICLNRGWKIFMML